MGSHLDTAVFTTLIRHGRWLMRRYPGITVATLDERIRDWKQEFPNVNDGVSENGHRFLASTSLWLADGHHIAIYLVDGPTVKAAAGSSGEHPGGQLPPLPATMVYIEPHSGNLDLGPLKTVPFFGLLGKGQTDDGGYARWRANICVASWEPYQPAKPHDVKDVEYLQLVVSEHGAWSADPAHDATVAERGEHDCRSEPWYRDRHDPIWRMLVESVHLITARGVELEPGSDPRHARRRFIREAGELDGEQAEVPLYHVVKVTTSDGDGEPREGERVYRHRWMVRGHWRHYQNGKRKWIRAYIKGPAGAPWIGTPVHDLQDP